MKTDPKLESMRGMSDPMPFAFSLLDKGKNVLVHAVIFTSYEACGDSDAQIGIFPAPADDPRMGEFVKYCWRNYLKGKKDEINKQLVEVEKNIASHDAEIQRLKQELETKEREMINVKS